MAKVSKQELRERLEKIGGPDATLLAVAMDLHMATTGSMECSPEFHKDALALLRDAIKAWEPNMNEFDAAVLSLIRVAVREAR